MQEASSSSSATGTKAAGLSFFISYRHISSRPLTLHQVQAHRQPQASPFSSDTDTEAAGLSLSINYRHTGSRALPLHQLLGSRPLPLHQQQAQGQQASPFSSALQTLRQQASPFLSTTDKTPAGLSLFFSYRHIGNRFLPFHQLQTQRPQASPSPSATGTQAAGLFLLISYRHIGSRPLPLHQLQAHKKQASPFTSATDTSAAGLSLTGTQAAGLTLRQPTGTSTVGSRPRPSHNSRHIGSVHLDGFILVRFLATFHSWICQLSVQMRKLTKMTKVPDLANKKRIPTSQKAKLKVSLFRESPQKHGMNKLLLYCVLSTLLFLFRTHK